MKPIETKKDYQNRYSFESFLALMKFEKNLSSKIFKTLDEFENKYQGEWTPDHMRSRAAELSILSYNSVWKLGRE